MGPEIRSRPLVFVDDLANPVLSDQDRSHLYSSLRLKDGDRVGVGDGEGRWRLVELGEELVALGDVVAEEPSAISLGLAFVPVKSVKPESTIKALTQLGVDRIYVISSERSVVRWKADRGRRQSEKWLAAAREASSQSRCLRIPCVSGPITFAQLKQAEAPILCEPGEPPLEQSAGTLTLPARLTLAIGPEGGWAPSELDGSPLASLPGRILRAETASVVAATLLAEIRDREAGLG